MPFILADGTSCRHQIGDGVSREGDAYGRGSWTGWCPEQRVFSSVDHDTGSTVLRPDPFDEGLDRRQHALDHDGDTFPVGVDAVIEVEGSLAGHAVEEERIEHDIVLVGEIGIDRIEGLRVFRPEIAPRHHPGEQNRNVALLQAGDGGVQSVAGAGGIEGRAALSLAPSARITPSVPSSTDQSTRSRPPDAVSPETPALMIVTS